MLNARKTRGGPTFRILLLGQPRWTVSAPNASTVESELLKVEPLVERHLTDFGPDADGDARWLLVFYYLLVASALVPRAPLMGGGGGAPPACIVLDRERFTRHLGPVMADAAYFLLRRQLDGAAARPSSDASS